MSVTNPQNKKISAFETVRFKVTYQTPPSSSIAGATFQLNVRDKTNGTLIYDTTNTVINDPINGVFTIGPIVSNDTGVTIGPGDFYYDIWRTDAGSEARLVYGTLTILTEQWK